MVWNVDADPERRTADDLPHATRTIEHLWIPMADGSRLAARVWLPVDAHDAPVPAILEYIPYRKNDFTAIRDSLRHPYFAGHGYASIRVDMRGSGDSDGLLLDEYLQQEQDDALEVLAWLEKQPWCTGDVGMIGKSWGGFNGLQVAALRPPQLKTIITICSTDDRYEDDVHYRGGAVLGADMLAWASTMLAYNVRPPDPKVVGESWREQWLDRLEHTPPFIEAWLDHQTRDDYWKHGSVSEDTAAVDVPVFAVGGWLDGYTNAVLRMLERLPGPTKGLIGPWAHEYPEVAVPAPRIGFLQECVRWFDQWLKGRDTGIMDEPQLRVWLQESIAPSRDYPPRRAGRWVGEEKWPSERVDSLNLWPSGEGLSGEDPGDGTTFSCETVLTHGRQAGVWCPFGQDGDLPGDQRAEDEVALSFTSAPVENRLEILGRPEVTLDLESNRTLGQVAVRLCDVAPDGASTLMSTGVLNLTHRRSHEMPEHVTPGERFTVIVALDAVGYALPAGHRWRLAISPSYWPYLWPSPEAVELKLHTGETSLRLPLRRPVEGEEDIRFESPETTPVLEIENLRPESRQREVTFDESTGEQVLIDTADTGLNRLLSDGITFDTVSTDSYAIHSGDPLTASARCRRTIAVGRNEWQTIVETDSTMQGDSARFHIVNRVRAYEGETLVFEKEWKKSLPRTMV